MTLITGIMMLKIQLFHHKLHFKIYYNNKQLHQIVIICHINTVFLDLINASLVIIIRFKKQ